MDLINRQRTGRDSRGRWTAGKSGNPAGRPPEPESFTAYLRKRGAELVPVDTQDGVKQLTRLDALALCLFELAAAGNVRAHALILERLDGKPAQGIDLRTEHKSALAPLVYVGCAPLTLPNGKEEDTLNLSTLADFKIVLPILPNGKEEDTGVAKSVAQA